MGKNKSSMKKSSKDETSAPPPLASASASADAIANDDRFKHMHADPRFRSMSRDKFKTKVDKRFKRMFTDVKFQAAGTRDERGRKLKHKPAEELRRLYAEEDEGEEEEEPTTELEPRKTDEKKTKKKNKTPTNGTEVDSRFQLSAKQKAAWQVAEAADEDEDDEGEDEALVQETGGPDEDEEEASGDGYQGENDSANESEETPVDPMDLARGIGLSESSSEDEDENDETDTWAAIEDTPDVWNVRDDLDEAPQSEATSRRLAVCNMDWDKLRAVDLFALANSFKPPQGAVERVSIYVSDFGKERLEREEREGPGNLIREQLQDQRPKLQTPEVQEKFEEDQLRAYQMTRLRYYYAILECDSAATAELIYEMCDGTEFEKSGNMLDLRFVPDEVAFDEKPTDVATDMPDAFNFVPKEFTTNALQFSNVRLTWDDDDDTRFKMTHRKFKREDLKRMNLEEYVASEDDEGSESSEDEEDKRSKYKALISELKREEEEAEEPAEMEITWDLGLQEKSQQLLESYKARKAEADMTLGEKYVRERKLKKRLKKKAAKQGADESGDESDDLAGRAADPFVRQAMLEEFGETLDKPSSKTSKAKKADHASDAEEDADEDADEKAAAASLALLVDEEEESKHFNMSDIARDEARSAKTKRRRAKAGKKIHDDEFEVDVQDPRFKALYESQHYSIDPTNPNFTKTKASQKLLEEKRRRLEAKRGKKLSQSGKRTLAEAGNDDTEDRAKSAASGASRKADLSRVINKLKKSKVVQ